ncbi:MAG: HIT domain-containing protein [Phycisphaerae bacterium]|nr:HIT domain-containing protein [Phycisphaerae bacterium]
MSRDTDCIFCKIIAGEIPCAKLLEEEHALAFLDIGPVARGHALLIPKGHYQTLDEMPPEAAAAMFRRLPELVRAVQAVTECEGINVLQNNGRIAGQVVPHVHVHVIPREKAGRFSFNWPAGQYEEGQIDALAKAIRRRLSEGEEK